MRSRSTWHETWQGIAQVMALRSRCTRDQVGAVIVDADNRVIATSYNGPPAGWPETGPCINFCQRAKMGPTPPTVHSYVDCVSLHAEANSLMVCDRVARLGGTIYVTSDVCWNCAKLIANSGLARVVVPFDQRHGYRDSRQSYEFLERCGIEVLRL